MTDHKRSVFSEVIKVTRGPNVVAEEIYLKDIQALKQR